VNGYSVSNGRAGTGYVRHAHGGPPDTMPEAACEAAAQREGARPLVVQRHKRRWWSAYGSGRQAEGQCGECSGGMIGGEAGGVKGSV